MNEKKDHKPKVKQPSARFVFPHSQHSILDLIVPIWVWNNEVKHIASLYDNPSFEKEFAKTEPIMGFLIDVKTETFSFIDQEGFEYDYYYYGNGDHKDIPREVFDETMEDNLVSNVFDALGFKTILTEDLYPFLMNVKRAQDKIRREQLPPSLFRSVTDAIALHFLYERKRPILIEYWFLAEYLYFLEKGHTRRGFPFTNTIATKYKWVRFESTSPNQPYLVEFTGNTTFLPPYVFTTIPTDITFLEALQSVLDVGFLPPTSPAEYQLLKKELENEQKQEEDA